MERNTYSTLSEALQNWPSLLEFLRNATEKGCDELLSKERSGRRRLNYLLRIHGRYNVLRAQRERSELLKETSV